VTSLPAGRPRNLGSIPNNEKDVSLLLPDCLRRGQSIPGVRSLEVKRPRSEADYSVPTGAEINDAWTYASILFYISSRRYEVSSTVQATLPLFARCLSYGKPGYGLDDQGEQEFESR
jgi:hypothetical protein